MMQYKESSRKKLFNSLNMGYTKNMRGVHMRYRLLPRLLMFFFVVVLVGVTLEIVAIYVMVADTQDRIDTVYMETQKGIIENIYNREVKGLELLIQDYAQWDDLYDGIQAMDYDWANDNATQFIYEDERYNLDLIYIEGNANAYYQYFGENHIDEIIAESDFYQRLKKHNVVQVEPVLINGELFMLAGSPVTTVDRRKLNGYYIMGRKMTDIYTHERLSEYLGVDEYIGVNEYIKEYPRDLTNELVIPFTVKDKNGQVIKEFDFYFNMKRFHASYSDFFGQTALITFFVALFAYFGITMIVRKIHVVLRNTIVKVDRVAKGDYAYQIDETLNFELDELIAHVNVMGKEIDAKIKNIRDNHIETLGVLINAVEEKDEYTRGHSERVTAISVVLAESMGYDEIEFIEEAALLHDIGKIGIPEGILNKPGRLTDEEFKIIKTHPEKGERILSTSSKLLRVAKIVRQHHERVDGNGYPDRLNGEEIELEARIIAVADAFDAMTSHRPYRKAMSFENGIDVLLECSGSQFDSEIVEFLVQNQKRIKDIIYK